MNPFLFSLNAILPIILLVLLGYFLGRAGLINLSSAKLLNKLVFHIFLPTLLFLNIYKIENIGGVDFFYIGYAMLVVFLIFLAEIPLVRVITKRPEQRGVLLQASFRSNYALIGIPLAGALFGEEGTIISSALMAFVIILFNMLAVVSLSLFSGGKHKPEPVKMLLGILKNPLIIASSAGIVCLGFRALFENAGVEFRLSDLSPLMVALEYLSEVATPLALIALGAQFEFSALKKSGAPLVFGTLVRTVAVPALGLGIAYFLFRSRLDGAHFAAFVALFATPVAVSSVPMAQEMGGDTELAGQLVVSTTLLSAVTIFVASTVFKSLGIF